MNFNKTNVIAILLILIFNCTYSQEFVTPYELEDGWGFGYDYNIQQINSFPKSIISSFKISDNGKKLYYETIEVNNQKNGFKGFYFNFEDSVFVSENWEYQAVSNNENDYLVFHDNLTNNIFLKIFNDSKKIDCIDFTNCETNNLDVCLVGEQIIRKNANVSSIVKITNNMNFIDLYKLDLDELFTTNCPNFELLGETKIESKFFKYPINSLEFIVIPSMASSVIDKLSFSEDLKLINEIAIPKSENWNFSKHFDTFHTSSGLFNISKSFQVGKYGDIYFYTSFRAKSEPNSQKYNLYEDIEALKARDASGIYRIDTNGNDPVQLVRSWTNHPGGLQISGDGETIYYAYILPDSTSAIMKMDRFGKNKEIVFKLDPELLSLEKQVLTPKIYPNPANEIVTISGIEQGKLEIYDTLGKLLLTQDFFGQSQIDVSNFKTGIYIMKLESGGLVKFEKLLINK